MGDDERPDTKDGPRVSLDAIPLHSTNLLTVLDGEGIVQYESPAIERIFGFDQDALVGESVAEYFHPDDRERVLESFETVVESESYTVEAVEYRHARADESYLWVESVASSNPTPAGHYVVNTRDISDRKARERELERTNERLDEFASVASHDLRNPLSVAVGRLDLAMDECDSEHLEAVANAHDRMEELIDGLLAFSRAGTEATDLEPVALATLAEDSWQNVETAEATLEVETDLELLADETRVRQLLENLFSNAIEHGGEAVTVRVGELPNADGFYLEDDGPGIPEHAFDEVFESGYSSQPTGTGLGLATVSQIVQAHGWDIRVTEGRDGGARFEITGVDSVE